MHILIKKTLGELLSKMNKVKKGNRIYFRLDQFQALSSIVHIVVTNILYSHKIPPSIVWIVTSDRNYNKLKFEYHK